MFRRISALLIVLVVISYTVPTLRVVRQAVDAARRDYRAARDSVASVSSKVIQDAVPPTNEGKESTEHALASKESRLVETTPVALTPAQPPAFPESLGQKVPDQIMIAECVDSKIGTWISKGDCEVSWTKPQRDATKTLVIAVAPTSAIGATIRASIGPSPETASDKLYLRFPSIGRIEAEGSATPVLGCDTAGSPLAFVRP